MRSILSLSAKPCLVMQLVIVLFFSTSLYFYLQTGQKSDELRRQQALITQKRNRVLRTEMQLQAYKKALAIRPDIKVVPKEIRWEEVAFVWRDISFRELLHRLDGIYAKDRTFTLERFSLVRGLAKDEKQGDAVRQQFIFAPDQAAISFTFKGYFLCLCQ